MRPSQKRLLWDVSKSGQNILLFLYLFGMNTIRLRLGLICSRRFFKLLENFQRSCKIQRILKITNEIISIPFLENYCTWKISKEKSWFFKSLKILNDLWNFLRSSKDSRSCSIAQHLEQEFTLLGCKNRKSYLRNMCDICRRSYEISKG